ncbi:MAG: hypothetical protein ACYSR0_03435 [Planctomycetota bacterium]|jgi:hypothetical protein
MVSNTDSDINKSLGEFKECLACDTSFKMEKQTLTDGIDDPEVLNYNFEIIECVLNSNTKKDIDGRKFYILMKKKIIKRKFIMSL